MTFSCCLSIAGIVILLETDHPLIRNREFEPFFTEEAEVDFHAKIQKAEFLPQVPDNVIFSDKCCRIAVNDQGEIQKFFYEIPEDPVCYAMSAYDSATGRISVKYLESYSRCVSEVRNCFYLLGFEAVLLAKNRLCLHASCVNTSMNGLLFSGVSGIGKSTQAALWQRYRGAVQINGDRPILACENGIWVAWGSPYAGSSRCYVNDKCPITAIVLLKQSEKCAVRRLNVLEAFCGIWAGLTVRSWDASFVNAASLLTVDLVEKIPVFEFSCTPDENAVDYLEQVLRKECDV